MKKHGFTLIELMAVIVIICIVILIGNSIVMQCLGISKNTENNTIMQDKYRNIVMNIEKSIKESEVVESYKGKNINVKNIGQAEELLHLKINQSEKVSYIYILKEKENSSLKELHLIKVNDSSLNKNIVEAEENTLIEDSISQMIINKSDEIGKLIDVNVDLKIMNNERNYVSSISKTDFVFKDEIIKENVDENFLNTTLRYTLNVLSDENSDSESVFKVTPKGNYNKKIYYIYIEINGEKKLYEIRLINDLSNDIHLTNTTIYSQSINREYVDIMRYPYPNEFKNQKPVRGPNLKFDTGKYIISYSNPYVKIRNNSMNNPYNLKDNEGKIIGISEKVNGNKYVILINGDLIIKSTEHIDSAYIYCTGKIILDTKASISITNSKLVSNKGIIINDVSSLNIVGNENGENTFNKEEIKNVIEKYAGK